MFETSHSLIDHLCNESDAASWQRLVQFYSPLLRGWIRQFELQPADADDVVQEVLLAVSRELPSFQHSGRIGAFRKWLRQILVHRIQNHWRERDRGPIGSGRSSLQEQLQMLADDTSSLSQNWDNEHDRHVMSLLLQRVRPRFEDRTWEAFQRVMFRGERANVVAEELGMTLKAVHLAKSRVLHALRAEGTGLVDVE